MAKQARTARILGNKYININMYEIKICPNIHALRESMAEIRNARIQAEIYIKLKHGQTGAHSANPCK